MVSSTKMITKSSRISRCACSLQYALLIWCISLFASISILAPQQVYARSDASTPGGDIGNPTVRAVDIAKPAVVRILAIIHGHLTVRFPPTTEVSFPQQPNGNYPLGFSGTGMFISSQGDVLTADHVVQPPKDQVLNPALYSKAAQDVANFMNQNAQGNSTPISPDEVVQQLTSGKLQSSTAYDPPTLRVYLSTDYAGTFTVPDLNSVPSKLMATVDKIKAQSAFDQQDVAIVHVPITDTPSIALGNSDDVQPQDKLTVIGFPGNADVSLKPQDLLTSSISSVSVSAKKTNENGAPLIQIDGNITHGNSGGPALNSQGGVVGIVSFGPDTGGNTSFLQASSSARALAQSINLDTTPGPFQKLWSQAFEDYAATTPGHWHKAQQEFTQLAQSYPQFQAVQPFLTYAQTQARTESDNPVSATPTQTHNTASTPNSPSPGLVPWQTWAIGGGAVTFLLVLAVSLFTVSARKRKRKTGVEPNAMGSKPAIAVPKAPDSGVTGQNTLSLKVWPCGHMNRSNARFCSICGESAPVPPGK